MHTINKKAIEFVPVLVQRTIGYECGCRAEFPVIGQFSDRKEWHAIPCYSHTVEELELRAETDWRLIHNGKL